MSRTRTTTRVCRRRLQAHWSTPLWLCASLLCSRAAAQEASAAATEGGAEEAGAHFERGVAYYEDGDYRAALIEFQRAYTLQHAYQLLYNLGQVAAELRDYAGAERYFRRYLVDGEDAIAAERRAEVQQELARLKARVGSLNVRTNQSGATIHVDDREIKHPDAGPVRVSAGQRQVVAEKRGYFPVRQIVDVLGGEEVSVQLDFGPPIADAQRAGGAEAAGSSNVVPWITGVSSAVLLLGAAGVGYWAYKDSAAYSAALDRFTTRSELDRLADQTRNKALVADILFGVALAGGIATVVLLVTAEAKEKRAADAKPGIKLAASGVELQF